MAEASTTSKSERGCVVCQSSAGSQKLLDCLHVSCVECLQASVRGDGTVSCPVAECDVITRLSSSSSCFMGLESLPSNHLAHRYRQPSTLCDECPLDDTQSATKKCQDCSMLLCPFHVQSHHKSRRTVGHHLSDDLSGTIRSTVACRLHLLGEPVTYCVDCSRLLCARCLEHGVHKAHTHAPIDKAAASKRESLKQLLVALQCQDAVGKNKEDLTRVGENLQKVDEIAKAHSKEIEKKKEELLALLKKDEDRNITEVDAIRWRKRQALEVEEQKLKVLVSSVDWAIDFSQESAASLSDAELLDLAGVLERSLTTGRERSQVLAKELAEKERQESELMSPGFEFSATWASVESALDRLGLAAYASAFPFHFDKNVCGQNVTISCCGLKASCTAETTAGVSVVGSVGFSSGCHCWSMLLNVLPSDPYPRTIHVGVTDEPHLLDSRKAWLWRTSGSRKIKGASKWRDEDGLLPWEAGTVLRMELDFTADTQASLYLEASNTDNGPFVMEIKAADKKFYPYFYINHNQAITLLPCEEANVDQQ